MKRYILATLAFCAIAASSCTNNRTLPRDNWADDVYSGLCALIDSVGNRSASYDKTCTPYAVFDFDNTTVMNDIELTLIAYGIENLTFVAPRDSMYELLMGGLEDRSVVLNMKGGRQISASDIAEDIAADYKVLFDAYLAEEAATPLEQVHEMPEYLDFRAKLSAMYYGVAGTVKALSASAWLLHLVKGFTPAEIQDLTRAAADDGLAIGKVYKQTWTSPDCGKAGQVSISFDRGMAMPVEMKHLYTTLEANGITVYICSASLEAIVEALACNTGYGFDVPAEHIFGMRQPLDSNGRYTGFFDTEYVPTLEEGKTFEIRNLIAPGHGGKGPALVAGDSNGDYSMLSSFEDLGRGLIIDRQMPEPLATLYGKPGYLLQGRNPAEGTYIRSSESIPVLPATE